MTITPETRQNLYLAAIAKDDAQLESLHRQLTAAREARDGTRMVSILAQIDQVERLRAGRVERMNSNPEER